MFIVEASFLPIDVSDLADVVGIKKTKVERIVFEAD